MFPAGNKRETIPCIYLSVCLSVATRERASNGNGAGDANGDANGARGRRTNHEWARDAREDFVYRWDDDDDDDVFNVDIIIIINFISFGSGVDDENDGRWVWTQEDTETRGWDDGGDDDGSGERGG